MCYTTFPQRPGSSMCPPLVTWLLGCGTQQHNVSTTTIYHFVATRGLRSRPRHWGVVHNNITFPQRSSATFLLHVVSSRDQVAGVWYTTTQCFHSDQLRPRCYTWPPLATRLLGCGTPNTAFTLGFSRNPWGLTGLDRERRGE